MRAAISVFIAAAGLLALNRAALGGVTPVRLYAPLGRPVEVRISPSDDVDAGVNAERLELVLWTPWGSEFARALVGEGDIDLVAAFPALEQTPPASALWLQLEVGGTPDGPPLVIVPMWTAPRYESALTALARQILAARSQTSIEQMLNAARASGAALEDQVVDSGAARSFCGYRLVVDKRVRIKTSLGEMEFALRHDAAPNHASAFQRLVEGGFYDGTPIHRIVLSGIGSEAVLVQAGDPTGTGTGGSGERIAYEPTTLPQNFGVLSMARTPGDPNSASSQIVIGLDGAAKARLESGATAFGELTRGASVLREFAAIPVGPREPDRPGSPRDLPLAQLVIERAWTVDAPPRGAAVAEVEKEPEAPVPVER
ncbi:MAG: peptidylprolyl isomerase [Phycisphaerales bacterium]